MTREEAFSFLEISPTAGHDQIEAAFQQRYNYFRMLQTNAPNEILKKVHAANLEKLDEIRKLFGIRGTGASTSVGSSHAAPPFGESSAPPRPFFPAPSGERQPLAYIIVHTEGRNTASYPLHEGLNYICRKAIPGAYCVLIDDDPYLSRVHCSLNIGMQGSKPVCELRDDGQGQQGKPSTNGTYVNGQPDRISRRILGNYDTLQAGNTKLVFRWKENQQTADLEEQVRHTGFVKTVIINI
jgi:hypothetical protein